MNDSPGSESARRCTPRRWNDPLDAGLNAVADRNSERGSLGAVLASIIGAGALIGGLNAVADRNSELDGILTTLLQRPGYLGAVLASATGSLIERVFPKRRSDWQSFFQQLKTHTYQILVRTASSTPYRNVIPSSSMPSMAAGLTTKYRSPSDRAASARSTC